MVRVLICRTMQSEWLAYTEVQQTTGQESDWAHGQPPQAPRASSGNSPATIPEIIDDIEELVLGTSPSPQEAGGNTSQHQSQQAPNADATLPILVGGSMSYPVVVPHLVRNETPPTDAEEV